MRRHILFFCFLLLSCTLLSSCEKCATCYYLNTNPTSGQVDSVIFQKACGKKKELKAYEAAAKAAGDTIGKKVVCFEEKD